jgi:hypothetical protein
MNTAVEEVVRKLEGRPRYECGNCEWRGSDDITALHVIDDATDCIEAGCIMPAGQCPECGALVDEPDEFLDDYHLAVYAQILRKRGWSVAEPGSDVDRDVDRVLAVQAVLTGESALTVWSVHGDDETSVYRKRSAAVKHLIRLVRSRWDEGEDEDVDSDVRSDLIEIIKGESCSIDIRDHYYEIEEHYV